MKKSYFSILIISLMVIGLVLSGCSQSPVSSEGEKKPDNTQVYELNFQSDYMDTHPSVANGFIPWIKDVKEKSGGRLSITYFNPNTISPVKETYDAVKDGAIDIGAVPWSHTPGKFPVETILGLPLFVPTAAAGSAMLWELYETMPELQDQFKDVKVLWLWDSAPFQIHTTNKPIRTLEDLKGLRIIVTNPISAELTKLLGANPIEVLPQDIYVSLQRNMADGVVFPMAPIKSLKISEVVKYHTMVNVVVNPFYSIMSKDKWNSLPENLQKILDETTGAKMAKVSGDTLDAGAAADTKYMQEQGHEIITLSAGEKQRWVKVLEPMYEKAVKNLEAKGYKDAQKIFETIQKSAEKYSK